MALKKSQLYSSLWQSCDELRGGMDASQYKDYILTLLFMKYVSGSLQLKAADEAPNGITTLARQALYDNLKAAGLPRIHPRPRNGPPAGASSQRTLPGAHGALPA
jgi:type I restriction-modification system DNA methylase subunit